MLVSLSSIHSPFQFAKELEEALEVEATEIRQLRDSNSRLSSRLKEAEEMVQSLRADAKDYEDAMMLLKDKMKHLKEELDTAEDEIEKVS